MANNNELQACREFAGEVFASTMRKLGCKYLMGIDCLRRSIHIMDAYVDAVYHNHTKAADGALTAFRQLVLQDMALHTPETDAAIEKAEEVLDEERAACDDDERRYQEWCDKEERATPRYWTAHILQGSDYIESIFTYKSSLNNNCASGTLECRDEE